MRAIVFSDVDGTLLNSNLKIGSETRKAIITLQKKDIVFVIVSARSPEGIYPILKEHSFSCPIIAYSGAYILDENGEVLFSLGIEQNDVEKVLSFIENEHFDLTWNLFSAHRWIVKDKNDARVLREESIVKAKVEQGSLASLTSQDEVHKILCMCNKSCTEDIEKKLKIAFPNLCVVRSSSILIEIMNKQVNKGKAVTFFSKYKHVDLKDTIAFGDQYNDLEMLKTVGHGFLMDNAPDELKKIILNHTKSNDEEGIYLALKKLSLIP